MGVHFQFTYSRRETEMLFARIDMERTARREREKNVYEYYT